MQRVSLDYRFIREANYEPFMASPRCETLHRGCQRPANLFAGCRHLRRPGDRHDIANRPVEVKSGPMAALASASALHERGLTS